MADEDKSARIVLQCKVERLDRFHIEVVRRFVHQQHVGLFQDQLAEEHAALFATGYHPDGFQDFVVGEQHATERAAHDLLATLRPLTHPVEQRDIVFEVIGVILSVVAEFGALGPLHRTRIGLQLANQRAQQGGLANPVRADDGYALSGLDREAEILEQRFAVKALGHMLHGHSLAVQLLGLLEPDEGADTAGRLDLGQLNLVDLLGP